MLDDISSDCLKSIASQQQDREQEDPQDLQSWPGEERATRQGKLVFDIVPYLFRAYPKVIRNGLLRNISLQLLSYARTVLDVLFLLTDSSFGV